MGRLSVRKGRSLKPAFMRNKELTPKQLIAVPCPTCGAAIGEPCELHSGALRSGPHRDRRLSAADAVEAKSTRKT